SEPATEWEQLSPREGRAPANERGTRTSGDEKAWPLQASRLPLRQAGSVPREERPRFVADQRLTMGRESSQVPEVQIVPHNVKQSGTSSSLEGIPCTPAAADATWFD